MQISKKQKHQTCTGGVEMEVGGATVTATDAGGLGGGAGEEAEAEVVDGAAVAGSSGCSGGGASMLFDELPRPVSMGDKRVMSETQIQENIRTCTQNLPSTRNDFHSAQALKPRRHALGLTHIHGQEREEG
jgi:hypothetical protein